MPFLDGIGGRDAIRRRLTELWDYEKVLPPTRRGDRWFVLHNDGLQNQHVLSTMDGPDGERRVVLDPNSWSADGTVSLAGARVGPGADRLVYGISRGGSDWNEWRVLDLDTLDETGDVVEWVKFSLPAWLPDGTGFLYSRYDAPSGNALEDVNRNQRVRLHRLGTDQAADVLVYERPDEPEWGFDADFTEDDRHLVMRVWRGTDPRCAYFYRRADAWEEPFVELLADWDAAYTFLGNDGDRFYFHTDHAAPRGRVIAIDLDRPDPASWVELIPEREDTLEAVTLAGDRLIATYLRDAHSVVRVHRLDGTYERDVPLPSIGTAAGFTGRRDDTASYFVFTSFTTPGEVHRYDLETGETTLWFRPSIGFDPDGFETTQSFVTSGDGTRVPVFLCHRRGLGRSNPAPTYLYGYGGFNIPMTPSFSPSILAWMERGGVYAQACLRGGGEYGQEWHLAGTKARKQNVFDDCIATAEWLVAEGWTTPAQLVLAGGSNGGLLVGACMTQRPDLFAVCLPSRGVLDMLRFERFTIGWAWTSDYGTVEDPDDLAALLAYSPLHNLRPGTSYPATLVTTADHDDRVVPSHSFKFTAALQAAQAGDAPVLIRVETDAGHGLGTATSKLIEEGADVQAFARHIVGLD
jgi:prolyl oligopeptidase